MTDTEDHELVEESHEEKERTAAEPYGGDGVVSESDTDDNAKSNEPYGGQDAVDSDDT